MKQQKFLGDAFFVQILNFGIKPAWLLLIDRAVQNRLPPETYGNYFSLLAFSLIFSVLLDLGMNSFQNTRYARFPEEIPGALPSGLLLKFILSLSYIVIIFAASWVMGLDQASRSLLMWLAFNQVILGFILFFRSFLTALHRFRLDAIVSIGDKLLAGLLLIPALYLAFGPKLSLSLFVGVQTIALLAVVILSFVLVRMQVRPVFTSLVEIRQKSREMLRSTWPFALLTALMLLFSRTDAVMLRLLLENGTEEAGIYATGFRLLDAINMVPALFGGMLLPIFSKWMNDAEQRVLWASTGLRVLAIPAAMVAIISSVFASEWAAWLYPGSLALSAQPIIALLLPAFLPFSLVYIYGTYLTARGDLRRLNILGASAFAGNLMLNLILIPNWGAKGAAISTLITQSFFAVGCFLLASNHIAPVLLFQTIKKSALLILIWVIGIAGIRIALSGNLALLCVVLMSAFLAILYFRPLVSLLPDTKS